MNVKIFSLCIMSVDGVSFNVCSLASQNAYQTYYSDLSEW